MFSCPKFHRKFRDDECLKVFSEFRKLTSFVTEKSLSFFFFLLKDFLRPDDLWAPSSGDMMSKCCICGLLRFEI